jgi:hypothetical protein
MTPLIADGSVEQHFLSKPLMNDIMKHIYYCLKMAYSTLKTQIVAETTAHIPDYYFVKNHVYPMD